MEYRIHYIVFLNNILKVFILYFVKCYKLYTQSFIHNVTYILKRFIQDIVKSILEWLCSFKSKPVVWNVSGLSNFISWESYPVFSLYILFFFFQISPLWIIYNFIFSCMFCGYLLRQGDRDLHPLRTWHIPERGGSTPMFGVPSYRRKAGCDYRTWSSFRSRL